MNKFPRDASFFWLPFTWNCTLSNPQLKFICHTHSSLIRAPVLEIIIGTEIIEIGHQAMAAGQLMPNSCSQTLTVCNNNDG